MAGLHPLRVALLLPALLRIALLGAVALLLGFFFGTTVGLSFALLAVLVLLSFHMIYLGMLAVWLEQPAIDTVPEGMGTWAEVFSRLYRAHRASRLSERRLADNEERFRRTISALPEGIVLIDAALQIEWCNPVAEQHLSLALRNDTGLRLTNLVRDPAFVAYMTSGHFEQPLVFRPMKDPALALSVAVIEFEPARSIVLTRDVTQTERVDAMRRDFVANVSHELRTPLTVVNGFLETLLDAPDAHADPLRRHHLQLMHEQANRMHRLVEDLLMLSRLESQESAVVEEDVDMAALVGDLTREARALSAGRHTLGYSADAAHLRGSREELRSAFGNLVSNAIRYTPAGGSIHVHWRVDERGGAFSVEDTGIGIASEHLPRLTERFYRVDRSRSRETGGTGLGLAIVKHVLLRHQARLSIESQPAQGSTFTAWLPASRVIEPAPGATGTAGAADARA
jgi:two-component system, OmpR family, phosphate regulon sensor histidine kinase PhoR